MLISILLSLLLSLPLSLHAEVKKNMINIGSAEFYWAFFKVYDVALYTESGRYDASQFPLALRIKYARKIKNTDLIDSTIQEWKKQNIQWKNTWIDELSQIWPSVNENDELMLYVDKQQVSYFYLNNEMLGSINDPLFASRFLSIWLSEKTTQPTLRKQLLGIES